MDKTFIREDGFCILFIEVIMEYNVLVDIEIDGDKLEFYTNVVLRQKFNDHHEFAITVNQDVLESAESFNLKNAQKKIGKTVLIRFKKQNDSSEVAYEFIGIICSIRMERFSSRNGDLVLMGYSPTILLENGQNFASFYKNDLKKIVTKIANLFTQNNFSAKINNEYKKEVVYISQYRESNFQFLNRISSEFSEWMYYDGKNLNFGKPASQKEIDIAYGEDINSMQLALKIQPMSFTNYSYISKEDKVVKYDAPSGVDGLDQYSDHALKESNKMFSDASYLPIRQRISSKSDLETFVKKQKSSLAANLEVLTGTSDNPAIYIGVIINLKISRLENNAFKKEDYGKFLITAVEHYVDSNGKYYNSFEAIPSNLEVIPVNNIIMPLAEPQIAIVKDNKDPDKMGRVRVQMLWQQNDDMTDWIRVMTPDAGGGKDGAKNRGLVVVPEPGDQVVVSFRYNDPDRPFVLGSLFHGKTAGGGGDGNKTKSLIALSGSKISLDGKSITIVDAEEKSKIFFDGDGKIEVTSSESITFTCGDGSIEIKKDGKITLSGKEININGDTIGISGTKKATMSSGPASFTADGQKGEADVGGTKVVVNGDTEATLSAGATTTVSAGGKVAIQGAIVALN